jgi:hypothetical protein
MSNKYLIVLFLLAASLKGRPQSCQKTDHGLTATAGGIQVDIQFLSPEVIRVVKYPAGTGNYTGAGNYTGTGHPKNSFSVVQQPGNTWFTLTRENGDAVLRSIGEPMAALRCTRMKMIIMITKKVSIARLTFDGTIERLR